MEEEDPTPPGDPKIVRAAKNLKEVLALLKKDSQFRGEVQHDPEAALKSVKGGYSWQSDPWIFRCIVFVVSALVLGAGAFMIINPGYVSAGIVGLGTTGLTFLTGLMVSNRMQKKAER